jgi:hypothetical protein
VETSTLSFGRKKLHCNSGISIKFLGFLIFFLFFDFVLVLSGFTSHGCLFEMMEFRHHTVQNPVDITTTF